MNSKVVLIGFMGSGKTTIGRALADTWHKEWIDLDSQIEIEMQMAISALFTNYGEDYFRQIENKLLTQMLDKPIPLVVSTGGGIIEKPKNRFLLKDYKSVYLKWDFDSLYERIAEDRNRPLVKSYKQLKDLYIKREPLYIEVSSYVILCEGKGIDNIVKEIIEKVGDTV